MENRKISSETDGSFILKKNKSTGNYTILTKTTPPRRIRYTLNNVYLPYGKEDYNQKVVINGIITDRNNYTHNIIVILKKIATAFENLKNTKSGKFKYGIDNKKFFSFLKEIKEDNQEDNLKNNEKKNKRYQIRMYLRYGAKITHTNFIGEMTYDNINNKRCNIDIELGSLWINEETMSYGINIYITHITILN